MGILHTAERSTQLDPSENVVFQRHLIAYKEAAKIIKGTVLEIGTGEGYGIMELAPISDAFIAVDKYRPHISKECREQSNITFIQTEVPPLTGIDSETIDFVITFQVIEHIRQDKFFLNEIKRVLKPGGKLVMTTPNILMSFGEGDLPMTYGFNLSLPKLAYLSSSISYYMSSDDNYDADHIRLQLTSPTAKGKTKFFYDLNIWTNSLLNNQ